MRSSRTWLHTLWRDNLDENGAAIRMRSGGHSTMVAPSPDGSKPLVTVPRAEIDPCPFGCR